VLFLTVFARFSQLSYLMVLEWVILNAVEYRVCLWFTELVSGLRNLRDILRQFLSTACCSKRTAVRPLPSSESGQFTSCSGTLWHVKHALLTANLAAITASDSVHYFSREKTGEDKSSLFLRSADLCFRSDS